MKPSLYLETTIPSYLAARPSNNLIIAGRQAVTHEFYKFERHKYEICISEHVLRECSDGDASAAKRRLSWLEGIEVLNDTAEVKPLAEIYARLLSIPEKSKADALHLAICCIHGIDILLSWNCKHLGFESMRKIQRYNDANGLQTPQMITPDSLIGKNMEVNLND